MTERDSDPDMKDHALNKVDLVTRVLKLLAIFATASLWLYYLATSLPPRDATNSNSASTIKFPKSFEELHMLSDLLRDYSDGHFNLVLLLFSSAYLYKQAFAIPGSVFLNILAGALYGPVYGTVLTSAFSAVGASCCYLSSKHIFGVLISHYFHERVTSIRTSINKQKQNGSLFNVLISLRFFPMSPNWLMNMSAPLCGVPLGIFALSVGVGLVPYNFICAQAGSVASQITGVDDLLTGKVVVTFVLMALAALVPVIFKNLREKK